MVYICKCRTKKSNAVIISLTLLALGWEFFLHSFFFFSYYKFCVCIWWWHDILVLVPIWERLYHPSSAVLFPSAYLNQICFFKLCCILKHMKSVRLNHAAHTKVHNLLCSRGMFTLVGLITELWKYVISMVVFTWLTSNHCQFLVPIPHFTWLSVNVSFQ